MTDWTGGPEREHYNELDGEYVEPLDELDSSGVTEQYRNAPEPEEFCEFGCLPMDHGIGSGLTLEPEDGPSGSVPA
jgi:hypothetical protein